MMMTKEEHTAEIIRLLEYADDRALRLIYVFVSTIVFPQTKKKHTKK